MKVKHLVIDAAGFVKNLPLWEYGEELYSISEVIAELRDKATRERYESLPVAIKMRDPQPWAIRFVNQFSKKTGDYSVLSLADVKILALTYELEIEARGSSDHLRTEPQKCIVEGPSKDSKKDKTDLEGFHLPQEKEGSCKAPEHIGQIPTLIGGVLQKDMESLSLNGEEHPNEKGNEESDREDDLSELTDEGNLVVKETDEEGEEADIEYEDDSDEIEGENFYGETVNENNRNEDDFAFDQSEDDDDDDDEGWITPSNIKQCKLKEKMVPTEEEEEKEKDVLVACVTSDFAVQNVLKHIGLSVMGVEGKIIRQIKTFTLRCYACFKLCSDMSKIFCPKCGNKTLKRVSVTVNPDGTQKVWINFKKPINTRGMIFSLPRPKGGQHARNPILVADQKEVRQFSSKISKKKTNPLHEDYDPDAAPFAIRDVYSRAAQLGYMADRCHNHYYWEKKNPNERTKKYKKKKK
ncbi:RNA-binding protein NOB1-like isoform X2 [Palaemon carinicauda]|uniref:RNA-binding protein NOB1-like isoform X2 n=1 Tax=Palaemon carinicauda TaxID=392227 RepID=UPI0035B68E75